MAELRGRGKAQKTISLIRAAIEILQRIQPCGIRAVCYQLFIQKLIASMDKPVTNEVGRKLGDARDADVFDWRWITDDTRQERGTGTWPDFNTLLRTAQRTFRRDRWQLQPEHCVVFSEKSTVEGTLAPVLEAYGVDFLPLHGHSSDTKLRQWAETSRSFERPLRLFYVGDYDLAGMDMSERDVPKRLRRYGGNIDLRRIALTHADTLDLGQRLSYPAADKGPRCKKCNRPWSDPTVGRCPACGGERTGGDKRYPWYVQTYGPLCWELDALDPRVLRQHVEDAIRSLIDWDAWARAERVDQAEQASAAEYVQGWNAFLSRRTMPDSAPSDPW